MAWVRRHPPERITELARGLVRGDYLVVEERPEWRTSLMLMAAGGLFDRVPNLGAILVPTYGVHARGRWINGVAPAATFECVLVAKGDVPALTRQWQAMWDALHPDG